MRERLAAPPREWAPEAAGRAGEESPRSRGAGTRGPETTSPRTGWGGGGTKGWPEEAAQGQKEVEWVGGGVPRDAARRGTQLTVPPSLMMIFLASMILRFAARFFFFPWVILPSSSPGAAAATPGAAGPCSECRPATTAGPSRSGRPPPS